MANGYGQVSTNNFSLSKYIVDLNGIQNGATHVSVQAAINSHAINPGVISIKPGTYTENITLVPGVNISAFGSGDALTEEVIIKGKISAGTADHANFESVRLEPNGDNIFEDTGSVSGTIYFNDCTFRLDEAITCFNTSNSSRVMICNESGFQRAIVGVQMFACAGGSPTFRHCTFSGVGSQVASTISSGIVSYGYCVGCAVTTTSGTAQIVVNDSTFGTSAQLALTIGGSGGGIFQGTVSFRTTTAQSMVISAGSTLVADHIIVNSTDDTPISGTGSIWYASVGFIQAGDRIIEPTRIGGAMQIADLRVKGTMDLIHSASSNDDHALEIDVDANGFADVKALDITFKTGALAAGEEDEAILLSIDESASTGGVFKGYEVLTTSEGSAEVYGYSTGINVNAVLQKVGTFGDIDSILNKLVDVTAALASGGAGAISAFVADDDIMTFGDAAVWDEMEFILGTVAGGAGINPTFEYSTGGSGFSAFVPADGTNGLRNSGAIDWESGDLAGWATNTSGLFEVRMTRTRNNLSTTPILDEVQLAASTEYVWDKAGDLNVKSISFDAGSNKLDNYTEGTWTPSLLGSGDDPTVNYTTQDGTYTRIGNQCFVKANIVINTTSGGTGTLQISGLPFTTANDGESQYGSINTSGMNWDSATVIMSAATPNQTYLSINGMTDNAGGATVDVDDIAAGDSIRITLNYWI